MIKPSFLSLMISLIIIYLCLKIFKLERYITLHPITFLLNLLKFIPYQFIQNFKINLSTNRNVHIVLQFLDAALIHT